MLDLLKALGATILLVASIVVFPFIMLIMTGVAVFLICYFVIKVLNHDDEKPKKK